jgi:small subunit ribosomal protein S2
MVVVDPKKEKTAVHEALKNKIGVVALIDTNSNPSDITYPVPGNDDAIKSITIIMKSFADAVEEGYKEFAKISDKALKDMEDAKIVEPAPTEIKPLTIKVDAQDVVIADASDVILPAISEVVAAPIEEKKAPVKKVVKKKATK